MVLAEGAVEVEHQLRVDQVGTLVPVLRFVVVVGRAAVTDRVARRIGVVEDHLMGARVAVVGEDVGTQHAAQFQAVDDLHLGREVGVHVIVAVTVVTALLEQTQRVEVRQLVVEQVFARGGIILTVIIVGRDTRCVGDGVAVDRRLAVLVRIGEQRRHLHTLVLGRKVRTEVVALASVIGTHVVALLVEVAGRHHVGRIGTAARYADVVVLLHGRLEDLVHEESAVTVLFEVTDLLGREGGRETGVGLGDVEQRGVLPSLDRRVEDIGLLPADLGGQLDRRCLIQLTLLGRHEQHAVGGTRTVDGGRTGVLEHRDILDVRRIEFVERRVVGNQSVDDDQRLVVVHRTDTADVDVELVVSRVVASLLDNEAGRRTLQRLCEVGHRTLGNGLRLDLIDGAHRAAARRRTVTDDDHVVHHLRVLGKRHVEQRPVGYRKRLRLIADEREGQLGIGSAGDLISSVDSGRSSGRGAFDKDGDAEQGLACSVIHGTPDSHLTVLYRGTCIGCFGRKPKGGGNQQRQNRQNDFVPKFDHRY